MNVPHRCVAIALCLLASRATAEPDPSPAPSTAPRYVTASRPPDRAVAYRRTPTRELRLHVYLPDGWRPGDRRTAVVLFFGGGFRGGEPDQFFAKAQYLAGRGCVAICPDYRQKRQDGTTSEAAVEDARSAMRHVRAHAAELGIDPAKIVAGGGSAGAYLAAACAWGTGPDAAGDDATVSTVPAALVLYNPALDHFPVTPAGGESAAALRRRMLPLDALPAKGPPAVCFYGTDDEWLGRSQPELDSLRDAGYPLSTWLADGQVHGFFNRPGWHEATLRQTDAFLGSLGLLDGPPTIAVPGGHPLKPAPQGR